MGRSCSCYADTGERFLSLAIQIQAQIRDMSISDLKGVVLVERLAYDFPWNQAIFRDCLFARYQCLVLEIGSMFNDRVSPEVRGYGIMSVAADEAHILNLCVHPEFQSVGYGRYLLYSLIDRARVSSAERMFLEVRPSNTNAIRLYHSLGFQQIGVRPSYYRAAKGREDAIIFAASLSEIQ